MASPNQELTDFAFDLFQRFPPKKDLSPKQAYINVLYHKAFEESELEGRLFSLSFSQIYGSPFDNYKDFELFMTRTVYGLKIPRYKKLNFARFVREITFIQFCTLADQAADLAHKPHLGRRDMETAYVQTLFRLFDTMHTDMGDIMQLIEGYDWMNTVEEARKWMRYELRRQLDKRNTAEMEAYWVAKRDQFGASIDIERLDFVEPDYDAAAIEREMEQEDEDEDNFSDFIDSDGSPGPGCNLSDEVTTGVASMHISAERGDKMEE